MRKVVVVDLVIIVVACMVMLGPHLRTGISQSSDNSTQAVNELKKLKPQELLKEIRAREIRSDFVDLSDLLLKRHAEQRLHQPALRNPKLNPLLAAFKFDDLIAVLSDQQKVVYGVDNRKDVFQVSTNTQLMKSADAVLSLFNVNRILQLDDGNTSRIVNKTFGTEYRLCEAAPREPFYSQPCSAFCTAFLVAPDIVATAGHCINTPAMGTPPLQDISFVFGYRMLDDKNPELMIKNSEIYKGKQLIKQVYTPQGPDWALVKLDREVAGHSPVPIRRSSKVSDSADLYVIGHPCGLPAKYADGAIVRSNTNADFFVANLDTYGGNSGSPVFNKATNEVEGILARGERDFASQSLSGPASCQVSLTCPDSGCRGEDCVRITLLADFIPTN